MPNSPLLGYAELAESQALPATTVNLIDRYLEAMGTRAIVVDKDHTDPTTATTTEGTMYIVASGATGAWTGWANSLVLMAGGTWRRILPREGLRAYVADENVDYEYGGASWAVATSGGYTPGGTDVALADGGTGASLTDPNADRIFFWDDSAGTATWLEPSGAIFISGTKIHARESIIIACSDETTAITTGTAKATFRMPYGFTLESVRASVGTAPTGSTIIIDINESGTTILSTKLSIDASEKTSTTAASAAVISDTSLADDAEITIDFDQVGSTIAGAGVKVALIGYRP